MQWPILMKHLKIRNLAWRLGHRSEGTCKVTWSLGDSKLRRKGPKLVWAFKLLDSFAHKSTLRHTNQLEEILYRFWLWVTCFRTTVVVDKNSDMELLKHGMCGMSGKFLMWISFPNQKNRTKTLFLLNLPGFFRIWGTNCVRRSWAPWASTSTSAAPTRRWLVSVSVAKLQAVPVRSCTPHGNM